MTSPMMLDRERLAQYVGKDPVFEREFLGLLVQSTEECLRSLADPTDDIYAKLHAAKAGISVAAHEDLCTVLQQACDQTVALRGNGLNEDVREVLRRLAQLMAQMSNEIRAVIAS